VSEAPRSPARVLGVGGLALASFNCVVGAGIFGLPALAAAALGPAAILGYLVSAVLLLLVGLCFAEIGSRVTDAGGPFAYATVAFGPAIGGVVGTLTWVSCIGGTAAVANIWVDALAMPWPALSAAGPRAGLILGLYTVLAAVNVRSARHGSGLSAALAVAKLVPLVGLVAIGLTAIDFANLRWTTAPSLTAVGDATVLIFFAFVGIESGLCASAEVRDPRRTIPRAIFSAVLLITGLYIGVQIVAQGILGSELPASATPLVRVAEVVLGPWGARLMIATILTSTSGFLVADALCSPRVVYALATQRQLPAVLAGLHPDFGTPSAAIWTYCGLSALLAITGAFRPLAVFTSATMLVSYSICCLGLLVLRSRNVEQAGVSFRAPGGTLVPLLATALVGWLLFSLSREDFLATSVPVALSALVYGALAKIRRTADDQPSPGPAVIADDNEGRQRRATSGLPVRPP
jgi:basic amino acid/polyamine antiporter, APA family